MGKILVILSIVLAAASAAVGFLNRNHLIQTKEDLSNSQQQIVKDKASLEEQTKKVAEVQNSLTELTTQKQNVDSELAKQKSELMAKTSQLTEVQSKLTSAEGELAIAKTDILTKAEKITQLESQIASSSSTQHTPDNQSEDKATIAKLEEEKQKLAEDNESLIAKIAALQKSARDKETKQGLTNVTGRVLAVNQAWNFVVLSLGNKSGIDSNMEFLVKRGSTLIGKVRTTTVEPSTSIADIIPSTLARGLSIQPGDDIIYQTAQN